MDEALSSGSYREAQSSSTPNGIFAAVVSMLDPWKKQLEGQFRKDMECQQAMIKKLDEKDNSSMLERRLQDLQKELEDERELRLENVKYFMECIETIKDKIVELGAQNAEMKGQLKVIRDENLISPSSSKRQEEDLSPKYERAQNKLESKGHPRKNTESAAISQSPPTGMGSLTPPTSGHQQNNGQKQIPHEQDPSKSFLACKCGRTFGTKQALYSHLSHFNKEDSFVCKACGKRFQYACRLKNHLRKEHNAMELSHADMLENLQESSKKISPSSSKAVPSTPLMKSEGIRKRKCSSATPSINVHQPNDDWPDKPKKERLSAAQVNGEEIGGDGTNQNGFNETKDPTEAEPRYCLCNDVGYGEMVACDSENCPHEWFHYDCVGLTWEPKGEWYCLQCSVERKAAQGP